MSLESVVNSYRSKFTITRFADLNRDPLLDEELPEHISKVFKKHDNEVDSENNLKLMKLSPSLVSNVNSFSSDKKKVCLVHVPLSNHKLAMEEIFHAKNRVEN